VDMVDIDMADRLSYSRVYGNRSLVTNRWAGRPFTRENTRCESFQQTPAASA